MASTRSPRYPNISLNEAIIKARGIYEKEHMSAMTPQIAAEAMGYSGINGASLKTISSLKKYGLLEGRGDDVRLSKDAQTLILDEPTTPDYLAAIRRSALNPEVFSELRKQFPGTASERNISVYLEKQGFKRDAAALVAKNYKDSMALAGSASSEYDDGNEEASPPSMNETARNLPPRTADANIGLGDMRSAPTQPQGAVGVEGAPFRIVHNGKRLEIVANVDLENLEILMSVLTSYKTILQMLEGPKKESPNPKSETGSQLLAPPKQE